MATMLTSLRPRMAPAAAGLLRCRLSSHAAPAAPQITYLSKEMESAIPRAQLESFPQVGEREWVGHGRCGLPFYFDSLSFPYPAIRFSKWDKAYETLHQKEKGDWKNLSMDEKKQLYRHSFRYTLAEVQAPTGRWKLSTGIFMLVMSVASLTLLFIRREFSPHFPESFSEEWMLRSMYKQIMINFNPVEGVGSKWDYENNRWKEK